MPTRLALGIEYDGSAFHGWQAQLNPALPTVQETLEQSIAAIAAHPVRVCCAGRTDTGVHASAQVIHFDTLSQRPLKAWVHGVNSLLDRHIVVRWAVVVDSAFHARFSALSRRYRYRISNTTVRPALQACFMTHHYQPLDTEAMHTAGQVLLGEQDFSSFRAAACQSSTAMRNVSELQVWREAHEVIMEIEANAFLLHMVRNIMGTLLEIGDGRKPVQWLGELLALKDRTRAGATAPPNGLCLARIRYPDYFGVPDAEYQFRAD